jgi:hypothetical protein
LPLSADADQWAYLKLPGPLTEAQWEQMIHLLRVMKPALVVKPADQAAASGEGE